MSPKQSFEINFVSNVLRRRIKCSNLNKSIRAEKDTGEIFSSQINPLIISLLGTKDNSTKSKCEIFEITERNNNLYY